MDLNEKKYFDEILEIDKKYYEIISHFSTHFPKPLNLKTEKEKFFNAISKNQIYNPKLVFEKKEFNEKKFEELKNLKIDTKNDLFGFKKLYKKRIETKIYEILSHKHWGDIKSYNYVKLYRGSPSLRLLFKAKIFAKNFKREKVKFRKVKPDEVSNILKDEVFRLTKKKIKIIFDENLVSKVNINPSQNIIKINPNERFTTLDIERLKVHEIGVHYMRYFNGNRFGLKILESGTSNYIETEEGLAVYCEELKGVLSKAQMYIYAGRVIATYYAQRKSFYKVFKILKRYGFKDEDAFAITLRAKRNLKDTSKKGGFTKDYVYFSGYLKVKKYCSKNDIKDLFIGKIKIEDTKILNKFIKKNKSKIKTIFD